MGTFVSIILGYIIGICIALVIDYLIAKAFANCAKDKGYQYSTYFWVCFLLGMIGYCVVAALPDKILNEKMHQILKQTTH